MNWTPYFFRSFCLCSRTMLDMYWMWPEWASAEGSGHQGELGGPFPILLPDASREGHVLLRHPRENMPPQITQSGVITS